MQRVWTGLYEIGGGGGKGSVGILAHAGLAVTTQGRPFGLFAMDADFQADAEAESRRWVEGLVRAWELSAACPDTRVVSACDREGNFWTLLSMAGRKRGILAETRAVGGEFGTRHMQKRRSRNK